MLIDEKEIEKENTVKKKRYQHIKSTDEGHILFIIILFGLIIPSIILSIMKCGFNNLNFSIIVEIIFTIFPILGGLFIVSFIPLFILENKISKYKGKNKKPLYYSIIFYILIFYGILFYGIMLYLGSTDDFGRYFISILIFITNLTLGTLSIYSGERMGKRMIKYHEKDKEKDALDEILMYKK